MEYLLKNAGKKMTQRRKKSKYYFRLFFAHEA
jgi:hypothetical protein